MHEIKKCWDLRKDWWPYTRFDADTDNLVLKKYIKKVKKMLKSLGIYVLILKDDFKNLIAKCVREIPANS